MGAMGFTSVVLMLSSFAFAINADCSNEDLESKLFMCRDQADDIINSNQCSGIESKVELISNCFSGCEAIPSAIADESKKLMNSINNAVGSRCHDLSNSVHARVERSLETHQMTEISSCAVFCELVIDIPINASMGSLHDNCSDVQEKTRLVKKVMDTCAVSNAAVGFTLDWLTITIGCINIVNSFVTSVCGTYDLLKN